MYTIYSLYTEAAELFHGPSFKTCRNYFLLVPTLVFTLTKGFARTFQKSPRPLYYN